MAKRSDKKRRPQRTHVPLPATPVADGDEQRVVLRCGHDAAFTRLGGCAVPLPVQFSTLRCEECPDDGTGGIESLDLVFRAPASVSDCYRTASAAIRKTVRQAQAAAIDAAFAYVERTVALAQRDDGQMETAAALLGVSFAHHHHSHGPDNERRPSPEVHTHVLLTMCRRHADEYVAINTDSVCEATTEIDAVYLATLAEELAAAGFAIEHGPGAPEFEISSSIPGPARQRERATSQGPAPAPFWEPWDRDAAAVKAITQHLRALDEATTAGDHDLACDISNAGITVRVAGISWELWLREEDNGWLAARPTGEALFGGSSFVEGDLMGTVGPIDLTPEEIVRRLRSGHLQPAEPD